jgi:TonB family protein
LDFIPDILVDQPVVGGGSPAPLPVTPTPAQPPPSAPAEVKKPTPIEPTPVNAARAEKPVPKPPEPEPPPASETGTKPPPKKHVVQPNLKPVVKQAPEVKQPTKEQREAAAAAEAQRLAQVHQSRINQALRGISGRLSSSTTVTMPGGTGSGGASYASYSLFVKSVYQWAWRPPAELTDDSATATARVVIARDGTVLSARIETPSGVPALDRSVRAALDRVTTIGRPFPEGAKDDQRAFLIDFNLKAKEFTG